MRSKPRPVPIRDISFPLCLAPMVGLSHVGLRAIVRRYMPAGSKTIWPTEMLNSRRLPNQRVGATPETLKLPLETGLVPQILGNEEKAITLSVQRLEDWGAEGVDINMGCPVKKALQHNYGVALMGDPNYAAEVVAMAVRSTKLPISVKLRAGLDHNTDELISFVRGLEAAGASWLTLHPRLAHEQRRGESDWEKIAIVREQIKVPMIGNGDIQTSADAIAMLEFADMAMVGRALTARPWLMWQVGEELGFPPPEGETRKAPRTALEEGREYGQALLLLIDIMEPLFTSDLAMRKIRFFVKTGAVWLEFGHLLLSLMIGAKDLDEMRRRVKSFFEVPQKMMPKTFLRQ